jgi:hypothetical protein
VATLTAALTHARAAGRRDQQTLGRLN